MTDYIAAIPSRHHGDLKRCRRLIAEAARVGCTGVKFQLFRIEKLYAREILLVSAEHRLLRRSELPLRVLPEMSAAARDAGLKFGCTAFDLDGVDALVPHVDFLDVASHEIRWLDLIHTSAATQLPLTVSTSMADAGEAWAAVEAALDSGCNDLTLLHGVNRPSVAEIDCNLAAIGTLREMMMSNFASDWSEVTFRTGWSDHAVSPGMIGRAVHHWAADVVEFRFDLDDPRCWRPESIEPVIAGAFSPVSPACDGTGRVAPAADDDPERLWRADPDDGLRPTRAMRRGWPGLQPEARRTGPQVFLVIAAKNLGRATRCLALGEALRDRHDADVYFFVPDEKPLQSLLDRHGFQHGEMVNHDVLVRDINFLSSHSSRTAPAVCVIDSETPVDGLVRRLQGEARLVVVIGQSEGSDGDLQVVPTFGWEPVDDRRNVIGGATCLMIRDDVAACRGLTDPSDGPPRIVVSFGGTDANDLTARVAAALHDLTAGAAVQAQVVVAPGFGHARIKSQVLARRYGEQQIIVTGDPLEALLDGAALLITSMGVSVGEALVLGTPVAIFSNDAHDEPTVARLAATAAVINLGRHDLVDQQALVRALAAALVPEKLAAMREATVGLVDGKGAERVAGRIMQLVDSRRA